MDLSKESHFHCLGVIIKHYVELDSSPIRQVYYIYVNDAPESTLSLLIHIKYAFHYFSPRLP